MGMEALHAAASGLVPKPIGWGKLETVSPPSHFLLVEFKDFVSGAMPDPVRLGARVAAMHLSPAARSPTGMFGFPVQTFDGARTQAVDWDPSWTSFFSKLLTTAYEQDTEANGVWPELDAAYRRVQTHLIPRLIGALESDGRRVEPVIIHGDMWEGNVGTEEGTGDPWIYDCAAYYGHNEMELGIWRAERHQLKAKVYRDEYLLNCDPSEPKDEWDDRNRLYSAKTNLMHSACVAGSPARHLYVSRIPFPLHTLPVSSPLVVYATHGAAWVMGVLFAKRPCLLFYIVNRLQRSLRALDDFAYLLDKYIPTEAGQENTPVVSGGNGAEGKSTLAPVHD